MDEIPQEGIMVAQYCEKQKDKKGEKKFWIFLLVLTLLLEMILYGYYPIERYFSDRDMLTVTMLDVGQGDAFVLRSAGRTLLIDTGNHDDLLLQGLARQGIRHLDAVAITHADDDHCGSLSVLKGVVGVDCVLLANEMLICENAKARNLVRTAADVAGAADAVKGVSVGERIVLGRFALDVIGPDSFTEDGGNACLLYTSDAADEL